MHTFRRPLSLAIAAAVLAALPAASAPPAGPKTQVWIDVSTHSMAGMPELGGFLGRLAGGMMGGDKDSGARIYPVSRRIPASPGKVIDIAMYNSLNPGAEAQSLVPAGLGVGKSLPLVVREVGTGQSPDTDGPVAGEVTVHEYWGCGAAVRPGQPKTYTVKVSGADVSESGSLSKQLFVPDRDIDGAPPHVLWPNRKNKQRLPLSENASMVGQHQITGAGVPDSLKYELGTNADFMPKITLETRGELSDAIALNWQPIERARAYFIVGSGMRSEREMVMWSSADVPGAGIDLVNYLTASSIDRWIKDKALLPASTTNCTVPKGIFSGGKAGGGGESGANGMGVLSMVAYGPETNLVWPPKPADPKAPWHPEWNVRVRTKSTTTAYLGIDATGGIDSAGDGESRQDDEKPKKGLLRNLLRSL